MGSLLYSEILLTEMLSYNDSQKETRSTVLDIFLKQERSEELECCP